MKTMNMIRTFAALFAVCALMAASCEEKNPIGPDGPDTPVTVKPEFPSVVEDNDVAPGETLTLTFNANMDWTVSVPSSNLQWFWIQDNSFKVDKISGKVAEGKKESVTVQIGVSETEEFDMNRSCEVTLSMGGESKVIAKYMRPAKNRTLAVYAAKVEGEELVTGADGLYVYEEVEASSLDLVWSMDAADFRMPVKVDANCEWQLDTPEWLDVQVPESTVGSLELVFTGASVEAASGKVTFKAGDAVLKELNVSVPACGEVEVYSTQIDENGEFLFDENGGYLYTTDPVEAITLVWPGSDFRMPVMVDANCDWTIELPEWLVMKYSGETPAMNTGVVTFNLMGDPTKYPLEDATENILFKFDGQTIHQVAVTIPGCKDKFSFGLDMALTAWEFNALGQLMTAVGFQDLAASAWMMGTKDAVAVPVEMKDGRKVSENPDWITLDVQAYVQGGEVLQQRSITLKVSENTSEEREAYLVFSKDGRIDDFFESDGTPKADIEKNAIHILQYGSDMDYVKMNSSVEDMNTAGATFTVSENPRLTGWFGETDFRYTLTYSNVYARDNAFMSFARPFTSYKIFNAGRKDMTSAGDFWLAFTAGDGNNGGVIDMYRDMDVPDKKETGYVVFYDADGSVLAIIECVFDPEVVISDDVKLEFTEQSAMYAEMMGFTLEQLTEGELFDMYYDGMNPVYHLRYTMSGMPMAIKLPAKVKKHNVNPYGLKSAFRVNNVVYDEFFGPNDIMGEVVLSDEGAVEIYMSMPEGSTETMIQGNINFLDGADATVVILVCTLDLGE